MYDFYVQENMYDFFVQWVDVVSNFATPKKLLRKFLQTGPMEKINFSTFQKKNLSKIRPNRCMFANRASSKFLKCIKNLISSMEAAFISKAVSLLCLLSSKPNTLHFMMWAIAIISCLTVSEFNLRIQKVTH